VPPSYTVLMHDSLTVGAESQVLVPAAHLLLTTHLTGVMPVLVRVGLMPSMRPVRGDKLVHRQRHFAGTGRGRRVGARRFEARVVVRREKVLQTVTRGRALGLQVRLEGAAPVLLLLIDSSEQCGLARQTGSRQMPQQQLSYFMSSYWAVPVSAQK